MSSYLVKVLAAEDYGDEKNACNLCKKPVSVLYRIQLEEGGILNVCRSDLHRVMSMKAQTRKTADQAEPLFAAGNDREK